MSNTDQKDYWSSAAGQIWVEQQIKLDRMLQPVLDLVLDRAALASGARVLDVGSGTGASVAQAAALVGPSGHVTGLDISETMLAHARSRLAKTHNAACLRADAQTHPFEFGSYDALISRFGVMFFDDTTAAFANMVRGLVPGATLTLGTWGPAPQNPYFMDAAKAAKDVFGPMDKVDRTLPGPFAFEDAKRVVPMLHAAQLQNVTCDKIEVYLRPPGDLQAVANLLCEIGPANRALSYFNASSADRARLVATLVERIRVYETSEGLRIPALINLYQARTVA